MPVPTSITDLSDVAASNYPQSTDSAGSSVYTLPQNISAIIKKQFIAGSDVTVFSSGSVTLPTENSYITIQGTGFNITAFADCYNGREITVRFASSGLTLVHSAGLSLPGSTNITTTANDIAVFANESAGVWRCVSYTGAAGFDTSTLTAATKVITPKVDTSQGADIASAATINLETATGQYVTVTGTTTVTAITLSQGHIRVVLFSGALTLTNGASLVLPGGSNITTAAGDAAIFVGEASGVVRCISFQSASSMSMSYVKTGTFTKNLADASTTQTITGIGFTPSLIKFSFVNASSFGSVFGSGNYSSSTNRHVAISNDGATYNSSSSSIYLSDYAGTGVAQTGTVSSVSSGQFTVTWTKSGTGSPAITGTIIYEAIG